MLKFSFISMVCFIIIKIPKANITHQIPWHKSQTSIFTRKKYVLDYVMCPDSDRYFILVLYTDGNPCSTGVPHKVNDDACSDVQSKKMPVWLRVCWQKEHVCCVLSYRTWKITNTGICNTDLVLSFNLKCKPPDYIYCCL